MNHKFGFPSRVVTRLAAETKAYRIRHEGIERKEHRLRLRMGSDFMKTLLFKKSANNTVKNRNTPKNGPEMRLNKEKLCETDAMVPPMRDIAERYMRIVLLDGSVNNEEYRSATLLILESSESLETITVAP